MIILEYIAAFFYIIADTKERNQFSIGEWIAVILGIALVCFCGWGVVEGFLWLLRHIHVSVA